MFEPVTLEPEIGLLKVTVTGVVTMTPVAALVGVTAATLNAALESISGRFTTEF